MSGRSEAVAPVLDVWEEFSCEAEAEADLPPRLDATQAAASPTAQQWLQALSAWCESAAGATAKAELSALLRCGARAKDKVTVVANSARTAIGRVFRRAPLGFGGRVARGACAVGGVRALDLPHQRAGAQHPSSVACAPSAPACVQLEPPRRRRARRRRAPPRPPVPV